MLFRRRQFDADLDEEMRLHRELRDRNRSKQGLRLRKRGMRRAADLATTWFCERKAAICGDGIGSKTFSRIFDMARGCWQRILVSRC